MKLGKILYLAEDLKGSSGGLSCMSRNLDHILRIFKKENVFINRILTDTIESYLQKIYKELRFKSVLRIDKEKLQSISDTIKEENIDYVFLDSSLLGTVAKHLRRLFPELKILVFFHNMEFHQMKEQWRITKNPKFLWRVWIAKQNEIYCCRYANSIICLNKRDSDILYRTYSRKADAIIPISLKDDYTPSSVKSENTTIPIGLFVGSFFPPNVEAVDWFTRNVLPHVNIKFVVCGSGMDKLQNKFIGNHQIEIYGFVDKLSDIYEKADFVVLPILSGSGMKVKTAEALKYGKYIIALPEALSGYDVSEQEAFKCIDAKDMIMVIQNLDLKGKTIESSQKIFKEKYSYNVSIRSFVNLFSTL